MFFPKLRGYVKVPKVEVIITDETELEKFFELHEAHTLSPKNLKKEAEFVNYCQDLAEIHKVCEDPFKDFNWRFKNGCRIVFKSGHTNDNHNDFQYFHKSKL
jgi:hypothetical protein